MPSDGAPSLMTLLERLTVLYCDLSFPLWAHLQSELHIYLNHLPHGWTILVVSSSGLIISNLFQLQSILYTPARIILKFYFADINTFLKTSVVPVVFIGKYYKIKDSQMARTSQSSQLVPQIQTPLSDIQRPLIYSLLQKLAWRRRGSQWFTKQNDRKKRSC